MYNMEMGLNNDNKRKQMIVFNLTRSSAVAEDLHNMLCYRLNIVN